MYTRLLCDFRFSVALLVCCLSPVVAFSAATAVAAAAGVFVLKERVKQVSEDNGRLKLHVSFFVCCSVALGGLFTTQPTHEGLPEALHKLYPKTTLKGCDFRWAKTTNHPA